MSGITGLFSDPYFTGIGSSLLVPYPFPVAIAGRPYIIDTKQFNRSTVKVLRPAQDSSNEPGEQTLGTEGIWKRTVSDWSLGAGQKLLDHDGSVRARFRQSKGIDPWDPRRLQLLPGTEEKRDSANTNLKMIVCGAYAYVVDGTGLRHTTDLTGVAPTFTSAAAPATTISSVCTDGREVFFANGTDIGRTTAGSGASTVFSTDNADFVGYANGYLFGGVANVLNSYTAAATAAVAYTHFNVNFRWVALVATPKGIFAAGNSAERGEFFFIGFDDATGGLLPAQAAGTLNDGETLNAMTYYQGTMLLGTSRGLRLADIISDSGLAPGPVIEEPGAVYCVEPEGEFVWFGWSDYDATSTGLGRAKLSKFTEAFVPAYASDLMATETGQVSSVITFGGRRYFSINAKGFYGETTNLVAQGTIDSGLITYSAFEDKILGIVDIRHEPLHGTVEMLATSDDGASTYIGISDVQSSLAPFSEFGGSGVRGESLEMQVRLNRSTTDATIGPVVTRWTVRSIVVPLQADEIMAPILLYSTIDTMIGEGEDVHYSAQEEFAFMKGLESSRQVVNYQEGSQTYRVTIREVAITDVRGWDKDRDFFDCTMMVRMITLGTGVGSA